MPLVLEARHLAMVLAVLAEHLPEAELRVFGSRATGKAHRHSDLDLLVVGPQDLPWQRLMAAEEAFAESDLPFSVDLVEAWKADADFLGRIRQESLPLWPPQAA